MQACVVSMLCHIKLECCLNMQDALFYSKRTDEYAISPLVWKSLGVCVPLRRILGELSLVPSQNPLPLQGYLHGIPLFFFPRGIRARL